MNSNYFESDEALESYFWTHYATNDKLHALHPEGRKMGNPITNFVTEPLRHIESELGQRALDLGCGTGRTTFELRRFLNEVVGLDRSQAFISAAETMRQQRQMTFVLKETRQQEDQVRFELPAHLRSDGIRFQVGDACNLDSDLGVFDLVMLTQLIDRVSDPARCLEQLNSFVTPGGWLVVSTTCSWQEKFTPREKWLGEVSGGIIPAATIILAPFFNLHHRFHLPYFVRERRRGYEWSIAEVSLWQRTSVSSAPLR